MGEKVTLSKRELENRIAEGGRVFDRQADYMEYVNKQVFGFETVDEYKEMLDLLIQLRTPKLSKDFKPSVINDILSDSLQPLSDDDLRPMSEAIENMDNLTMNLKGRKEAYEAAGKINSVLGKYNKFMLYDKAGRFIQAKDELTAENKALQSYRESLNECRVKVNELEAEIDSINIRKETLEKERESLSKSDAVALKNRETKLSEEIEDYSRIIKKKENILADKEAKYVDLEN
ncbi:MAG: TIGR02680 family protein, partial [Clostridia bacterium]|nr:TIGR02680 family protein [Clostridia bacterium]